MMTTERERSRSKIPTQLFVGERLKVTRLHEEEEEEEEEEGKEKGGAGVRTRWCAAGEWSAPRASGDNGDGGKRRRRKWW